VLAQVGDELGATRMQNTFRALGFAERPYVELPARGHPAWPRGDKNGMWSRVTTITASYGHGFEITPLHLASAYAALVNGGVWRPATLQKLDPAKVPAGRRVWQAATSARMRQLLRAIVDVGTGKSANANGFRVGGKTGTAEQWDGHMWRKDLNVTTFAAAFPMDRPRYVVIATIDQPKATQATSFQRTAAWNAAPVVGRLVPRIGPLLGIMPDATRDIDISDIAPLIANGEGE
jgi:cell division protein FtsI (penicillin-binding protein 3)